jgi:hypothetical protein
MLLTSRFRRFLVLGSTFVATVLAAGSMPAAAQEIRCDATVSTGSGCSATQMPCPNNDGVEKPKPE